MENSPVGGETIAKEKMKMNNTKKILTNALKGMVEGAKYYIKLSDDDMMEPKFIDNITDYFMEIIYNLNPLDENYELNEVVPDITYDLAKKGKGTFYLEVGVKEEDWVGMTINSVEELADTIMEYYFPYITEE